VHKSPSATAATTELADGFSVQGLSTIRLSGTRQAAAQTIVPAAVTVGEIEENRFP
jgi:hypothetical protein